MPDKARPAPRGALLKIHNYVAVVTNRVATIRCDGLRSIVLSPSPRYLLIR